MNAHKIVDTLLENSITVGEIFKVLPPETVDQIMAVLNQPDYDSRAAEIKALLEPHAAALDRIGLVTGYAAYMLIYAAMQSRQQSRPNPRNN